MLLLRNKEQQ